MSDTRSRFKLVFVVLIVLVGIDQATKHIARAHLRGAQPRSYLGDTFRLQYAENQGAMLSLGADLEPGARRWIAIGISVALVGLLVFLLRAKGQTRGQVFALSFVLAGGMSNSLDRFYNEGRVIDFMNVGISSLRTGIFNVADMAILGGVIAYLFVGTASTKEPADDVVSD